MKLIVLLILSSLLTGCAHKKARAVTWSDGKPAYVRPCKGSMEKCFRGAGLDCPNGYTTLSQEQTGIGVSFSSFPKKQDFVYRCKE